MLRTDTHRYRLNERKYEGKYVLVRGLFLENCRLSLLTVDNMPAKVIDGVTRVLKDGKWVRYNKKDSFQTELSYGIRLIWHSHFDLKLQGVVCGFSSRKEIPDLNKLDEVDIEGTVSDGQVLGCKLVKVVKASQVKIPPSTLILGKDLGPHPIRDGGEKYYHNYITVRAIFWDMHQQENSCEVVLAAYKPFPFRNKKRLDKDVKREYLDEDVQRCFFQPIPQQVWRLKRGDEVDIEGEIPIESAGLAYCKVARIVRESKVIEQDPGWIADHQPEVASK